MYSECYSDTLCIVPTRRMNPTGIIIIITTTTTTTTTTIRILYIYIYIYVYVYVSFISMFSYVYYLIAPTRRMNPTGDAFGDPRAPEETLCYALLCYAILYTILYCTVP